MIFYATKETMARYNLKTPQEMSPDIREIGESTLRRETGNPLYAWGVKLFYFDRRKSLQFVHARTKMTVFLIDIKVADITDCGDILAYFLLELYRKICSRILCKCFRVYNFKISLLCFCGECFIYSL